MNGFYLNFAHLYGDLMNTYGDYGNFLALRYYAKQINVKIIYHLISLNDSFKANDYNILLLGGGQDYEEEVVAKDFVKKEPEVRKYIKNGGVMLAICGGFQLLGNDIEFADGKIIRGIGILPHKTLNLNSKKISNKLKGKRLIGNIIIKNNIYNEIYHGFENHQGRTFLGKNEEPLGTVIHGDGNNGEDETEGVIYKNVYGTYFHGPILTRNGNLAKIILKKALFNQYPKINWDKKLKQIPTEGF